MAVRLTITELGDPGSVYIRNFLQDRIVIGRAQSSDVCLPDMAISTRHVEIRLKENDYVAVDVGSVNGSEVNGVKLVAHRPRVLGNGDNIQIAGFRLHIGLGVAAGPSEPRDASVLQAREILSKVRARSGDMDSSKTSKNAMDHDHPTERSLRAIFEAPEELTSSFAFAKQGAPNSDIKSSREGEDVDKQGSEEEREPSTEAEPPPPIGPADPLIGNVDQPPPPKAHSASRTEVEGNSDLGLIIIGAIIVIAAVVGLVCLFS
ncbi:MAG: FHA domain-containing protein [Proteobacteria bacterium]|nr:FHA domain-containing protein [Pseudomonadota bacterium]